MAEHNALPAGGKSVQAISQVWTLNQRTTADLMSVTGESLRRWVDLNLEYLHRVAERPGPQRIFELNVEYGRNLLGGIWDDARQRVEVIARASREFTALLSGAATAQGRSTAQSADAASAAVAEMAAGAEAAAGDIKEAVEEALDDDLQQIDGIGEAMARMLREAGIRTIAELAMLDVALLEDEAHPLHSVAGRIVADEWVEQARALSGVPAN